MAPSGYFTDDSMLRRVHRERAVGLAGPRALLMQAAHPVAFAGFFEATTMLAEPYSRLQRTARVLWAIGFGTREQADAATTPVRAVHRRVRGTLKAPAGRFPAGTPYAADDPELLLWILATLVDSSLLVYGKYVRGLSRDEREQYWQEYKTVGNLFGLEDHEMPGSIEDFDAYMHDFLTGDDLFITDEAREVGIQIVMRPPVPLAARPLLELTNQITVGLLPRRIRQGYGLRWDPVRSVALHGGAEYVKRVLVPVLPNRLRLVSSARAA